MCEPDFLESGRRPSAGSTPSRRSLNRLVENGSIVGVGSVTRFSNSCTDRAPNATDGSMSLKHGRYTAEAIARRRQLSELIRMARVTLAELKERR